MPTKKTPGIKNNPAVVNEPAAAPRPVGPNGEVRIRMYRQGLGDCFLLSFRRVGAADVHVAIDCGVLTGSPDGTKRVKKAVDDIKQETGGRLDLLVATHEHSDHLCGFNKARDVWESFTINKTWLAWTEEEGNPAVEQVKKGQRLRLRAALAGLARLQSQALGLAGDGRKKVEAMANTVQGLLAFALDDDDDPAQLLNAAAGPATLTGPARALKWLKDRAGRDLEYCHPSKPPLPLPGADDVRVFVLGPPAERSDLRHSDPSEGEAYELFGGRLHGDACFGLALNPELFGGGAVDPETAQPFDKFYQQHLTAVERQATREHKHHVKSWRPGMADQRGLFTKHYFFADDDPDGKRRIDNDWLNISEGLALALTGHINNTSLALAFELGAGGPVLLFPGDAQAGSWRSWTDLKWEIKEGNGVRTVTGPDLLERTVFYKVGHHGSHNATMRGARGQATAMKTAGLELMNSPDLVAFIPVHQATAHRQKPVWKMPWIPMWNVLKEKAACRVILSDQDASQAEQMAPPPAVAADPVLTLKWTAFQNALRWDDGPDKLWVEYVLTR